LKTGVEDVIHAEGRLVTPGLVDAHTHLVYAGSRAGEFEERLRGVTYEEIARRGGGIRSTVRATRAASLDDLVAAGRPRLKALLAEGVTTVEIKSGYGLDLDTEVKMLRTARRLGEILPVTVVTTFLGAHALPPEFEGRDDEYIDFVTGRVLPMVAAEGLADAVDAFGERIAFSPDQVRRVFKAARGLGLPVKLHADQLSDQGGAALSAEFGALSADHVEHASADGIRAMGRSGTVALLLPGAFYFLKDTHKPPIDEFRAAGVPLAVATDSNPGSSPATSLLLMMNMAATLFGLTVEEAWRGVTVNAAKALGRSDRIGTLEPGKDADFVIWDVTEPAEAPYRMGFNPAWMVFRQGRNTVDRRDVPA
jgi:imidazolonepropionase